MQASSKSVDGCQLLNSIQLFVIVCVGGVKNLMICYEEDILVHHGILGQKWGVRRYQNPDGSLTSAGKRHYKNVNATSDSSDDSVTKKKVVLGDTTKKVLKTAAITAGSVLATRLIGTFATQAIVSTMPTIINTAMPLVMSLTQSMIPHIAPVIESILSDPNTKTILDMEVQMLKELDTPENRAMVQSVAESIASDPTFSDYLN